MTAEKCTKGVWDVVAVLSLGTYLQRAEFAYLQYVQLKEREARGYDIDDRVVDAQSTIFYYCRPTLLKGYIMAPPDVYRSYVHLTWRDTHSVSDSIYYTRKTSIRYFICCLQSYFFPSKLESTWSKKTRLLHFWIVPTL